MSHLLDEIVQTQNAGKPRGIPSICSAHQVVLSCALRHYRPVLIESTCNQVNQFGGYTGMTALDFHRFVNALAEETGFPRGQLILGGDHLGPSPWQDLPAEEAMSRAEELVRSYASTGFTKLHIDASMKLGGDDPDQPLPLELSVQRTTRLIRVAEAAAGDANSLRYVVGTEVPLPGGAHEHEEGVHATLCGGCPRNPGNHPPGAGNVGLRIGLGTCYRPGGAAGRGIRQRFYPGVRSEKDR